MFMQSSNSMLKPALGMLRIAVLNGADYEFNAHVPHALAAGMTQDAIDRVRVTEPKGFSSLETTVLRYCDAMTRELRVEDSLFESLQSRFDAKTMVELTATIASYNMVSRFLIAMRIH